MPARGHGGQRGVVIGFVLAVGVAVVVGYGISVAPAAVAGACGPLVLLVLGLKAKASLGTLLGLLALRTSTDKLSITFGPLNMSAVIGIAILCIGVGPLLRSAPVVRRAAAGVAIYVLLSSFVAVVHGFTVQSTLREAIRILSIGAVAVFASEVARRRHLSLAVRLILEVAAMAAALTIVLAAIAPSDRASGLFAQANVAGSYFAVGLVAAVWSARNAPRASGLRSWSIVAVLGAALLATKSVGALVAACAALLAMGLIGSARTRGLGPRLQIAAVVLLLPATFALSGIGAERFAEEPSVSASVQDRTAIESLDWRFRHWSKLIEVWKTEPVFGIGLGSTTVPGIGQPSGKQAHSDVVRLLVEFGLSGVVALGAAIALLARTVRRRRPSPNAQIAGGVLVVLLFDALVSNTLQYTATMYMAVSFLSLALTRRRRTRHAGVGAGVGVLELA